MKKYFFITLSAFVILLGIYFGFRAWSTHQADRDTDAFFSVFRESQESIDSDNLKFLSQDHSEVKSIIFRHSKAIYNFSYETTKPELTLALNATDIGISWHLNIRFEKHSGHWYPVYFDEYTSDPKKAEQGAAANP